MKLEICSNIFMKRIIVTTLAFTMMLLNALSVKAISTSEQQIQLQTVQTTIDKITTQIQEIDNDITNLSDAINNNKNAITTLQTQIKDIESQIVVGKKNLNASKVKMNARINDMYKNSDTSVISILLTSSNVGDAISKVNTYSRMNQLDKQAIDDYNTQVEKLKTEENKLTTNKLQAEKLKTENEIKMKSLKSKKDQVEILVSKYKSEASGIQANINASINASKRAARIKSNEKVISPSVSVKKAATVGNATQSITATVSVAPTASIGGSGILQTAFRYIGTPYVWGGTTPAGFDCSGFVQYVFAQNGISLPRTTYSQINCGVSVSLSNLQPGDLVFFGGSSPYHVGIYCGNGEFIHSPQTGESIKISTLRNCTGARRVG